MKLLLDGGADPNWVEPNGMSIDRHTIKTFCAMSKEDLEARWEDVDYLFRPPRGVCISIANPTDPWIYGVPINF